MLNWRAKKNITLAASEKISIFTETEGIEAIVAKGDLISQAQSGNIEVIAKQNISLTKILFRNLILRTL